MNNKIILPKVYKKGTVIRIYFSRTVPENGELIEYKNTPVATTILKESSNYVSFYNDYTILRVEIRKPKIFGLLKGNWEVVQHGNI